MENLTLLNKSDIQIDSNIYPDLPIISSSFDAISDSIICTLGSRDTDVVEVQLLNKAGDVSTLAAVSKPSADVKIISIKQFIEDSSFVIVFDNGDIVQGIYNDTFDTVGDTPVQIIGLMDSGIECARWSPDEERIVLLTPEKNVLVLSRTFETIMERKNQKTDMLLADDRNVNVGWGKEETQFKGKGFKALEREKEALKYAGLDLKEDTELRDPTVALAQKGICSPLDDGKSILSWRDDCLYFALSTKENIMLPNEDDITNRRVIRIFDRDGNLKAVSEALDGLEDTLSWCSQGSHIAATQRITYLDSRVQRRVVFFEKNGLKHGGFELEHIGEDEVIEELSWSCDGKILFVRLLDRIQLWTTKNYKWSLKQVIYADISSYTKISEITSHPEKALQFMYTSELGIHVVALSFTVSAGSNLPPLDQGLIAVIDGNKVNLTPLAMANIPPPMCLFEIDFPKAVSCVSINSQNTAAAVLTCDGCIYAQEFDLANARKCNSLVAFKQKFSKAKQICYIGNGRIAVLEDNSEGSSLHVLDGEFKDVISTVSFPMKCVHLSSRLDYRFAIVESVKGDIFQIDEHGTCDSIGSLSQMCQQVVVTTVGLEEKPICIGLSSNGKAFAGSEHLANSVTSLHVTDTHICLTTAQARLHFISLENIEQVKTSDENSQSDERSRMIEKGSIIITSIPSKYSLILQAYRGNLETIYPRMMVLQAVRLFIREKKFLKAFLACRTHRIDLDFIHDYDPSNFYQNIDRFVDELGRIEHLDLFLSCLHEEDVSQTKYKETNGLTEKSIQDVATISLNDQKGRNIKGLKINEICDSIFRYLSGLKHDINYLQVQITALACQRPPKKNEALTLISQMSALDHKENAIAHLCFLLDPNQLYDSALSIYDVQMALEIAQKSQKDPKEYLPFLQQLNVASEMRKRFLIDDHLTRSDLALNWLYQMEVPVEEEFELYVKEHILYKEALKILRYDEKGSQKISRMFADYLFIAKKYRDAALIYEFLDHNEKALESFILAADWKEAMSIVYKSEEPVMPIAERLYEKLLEERRYSECAKIQHHIIGDIDKAVEMYCLSRSFSEAILLATKEGRNHLIEETIDSNLKEEFGVIAELLADCHGQVKLQLSRLRELRQKKLDDPFTFYGSNYHEQDAPDDVSIAASETSTTPSFFTRYTGKTSGTAKTGASRKTSKNKKREERKKAKGRKGTMYEEEYLISSVGRLVERLNQTLNDATVIVDTLMRRKLWSQAYQIQHTWQELTQFLSDNIAEIYDMSEKDRERVDDDGNVYLIPKFTVPDIKMFPIREGLNY